LTSIDKYSLPLNDKVGHIISIYLVYYFFLNKQRINKNYFDKHLNYHPTKIQVDKEDMLMFDHQDND